MIIKFSPDTHPTVRYRVEAMLDLTTMLNIRNVPFDLKTSNSSGNLTNMVYELHFANEESYLAALIIKD